MRQKMFSKANTSYDFQFRCLLEKKSSFLITKDRQCIFHIATNFFLQMFFLQIFCRFVCINVSKNSAKQSPKICKKNGQKSAKKSAKICKKNRQKSAKNLQTILHRKSANISNTQFYKF